MTSIRLPADVEMKLAEIAKSEKRTKSDIIKKALNSYLESYFIRSSPYDLGKDLFGNCGSGQFNLSTDYKRLIKEKIHAKHSHRSFRRIVNSNIRDIKYYKHHNN